MSGVTISSLTELNFEFKKLYKIGGISVELVKSETGAELQPYIRWFYYHFVELRQAGD